MNSVWRWEIKDRRGEISSYGTLELWGDPDEQLQQARRLADDRIAVLLYRMEPDYQRLAGWTVRVWSSSHGLAATSHADDPLAVLRSGPLANGIRRWNWRSRPGQRRNLTPACA